MLSGTITIISEKEDHDAYAALSFDRIQITLCSNNCAKDFLDKIRSDLVLLDCGYEMEDGLQLLKQLKSMRPSIPPREIKYDNENESVEPESCQE